MLGNIKTCIIEHLETVSAEFQSYFNDNMLHVSWYRDQFNPEVDPNAEEAEKLVEFKVSNAIKLAFHNKTDDSSFWFSIHDSYPLLNKKASVTLVQFPTAYHCKAGFFDLASIKTKSRNSLIVCSDTRLAQSQDGAEYQRSSQASTRTHFALTTLIYSKLTVICLIL